MRVLVDATGVPRNKAGMGVYGKNLIDGLIAQSQVELFALVQDDDPDFAYTGQQGAVTVLRVPSRILRLTPLRLLFQQTVLPFLAWKYRIDIVHSIHYFFPLIRLGKAKNVVTVHDMTSFFMPEVHIAAKMRNYRFFMRRARTQASGIIFISNSARQDYIRLLGEPSGLSTVIHHGIGQRFRPLAAQDTEALAAIRAKYSLPPRYILYVGTLEPRKNLERLIDAFATVAAAFPEVTLVLAGMMGWKQEHLPAHVQKLGLQSRVLFPGFVAEADKPLLIAGCDLFVYPSLYEGFGLPVLEALASGAPTISSDTSSIPEVAGAAALLVDPLDTNALAQAIHAVLSSSDLQHRLQIAGPKQAAKFTWNQTAAATLDFYREVN